MKLCLGYIGFGFFLIACWLAVNPVQGQSGISSSQIAPASKIKSAEQLKIKWSKLWKQKIQQSPNSGSINQKDEQFLKLNVLTELLEQTPAKVIDAEIERLYSSKLDVSRRIWDYNYYLLMSLVIRLVERNDKPKLVYLLSGKCPFAVGGSAIELYLAIKSMDNLPLFFEAYENAANQKVKKDILIILTNTFGDACEECRRAIVQKDKFKFIKVSRDWFEANKVNLIVNPYYSPSAFTGTTAYGLFRAKTEK